MTGQALSKVSPPFPTSCYLFFPTPHVLQCMKSNFCIVFPVLAWPGQEGAECEDGADDENWLEGPEQGALLHLARDLPAPQNSEVQANVC